MKVLIILLLFSTGFAASAQQKRLYIANDDHTDYMWTADEATYDSAFVHMLDYYLQQIDSTKNNPPDFQARFNCDGSLWLRAYEKHRSPQQFNKLIAAVKSGHISSPLNMLVSCFGAQPTEAVIRGMYYAGQLERKYDLRFTMAGAMENNTLPLGLASLWAGSGAKYSWKGIGGYGSQMSYEMRAKRKHQMYRYTGLDGSNLLMKWYLYDEKKWAPLGGYAECRMVIKYKDLNQEIGNVINVLGKFCDTVSASSAYPYNVAGAFGFGHDDLQTMVSNPFIKAAMAGTNKNTIVRVSNEEDFFKDFERSYPNLPSQSVSYGNEWDLLSASMNETTAKVRRATEKLRSAEALAAVVFLDDKNFLNDLIPARNLAWESLGMYWEHNWTADGPVSRKARAAWQMKLQGQLSYYADTLYSRSAEKLGGMIAATATPSFYVFNPLSWSRTDVADLAYEGAYPVKVIDKSTGEEAVSQLIQKDGKSFLRVLATNIPSVGYKVFELHKGTPAKTQISVMVGGEYISNVFYRVRLSRSGAITELYDKIARRQLVKTTDGKYINDLGAADKADGEKISVENEGPVSVTLKAVSKNPVLHTVRVTLFHNSRRIEIEDSIQQNFGDTKHWAFSFNLDNPATRHEELGAILTVKKWGRGGHYADENARYDYQTFNHFADMSEPGYGVSLSNSDCSFFKLGMSSVDSLQETSSQLNALAGGNVDKKVEDGGVLGILNQNGNNNFSYKFAIAAHQSAFTAADAMKFSLEHQTPLTTGMITGLRKRKITNSFSLLHIANPHVLLWSVKPSEDGIQNGLITRFWNVSDSAQQPVFSFSTPIKNLWRTSHIETNEGQIRTTGTAVKLSFKPHQIATYRVVTR